MEPDGSCSSLCTLTPIPPDTERFLLQVCAQTQPSGSLPTSSLLTDFFNSLKASAAYLGFLLFKLSAISLTACGCDMTILNPYWKEKGRGFHVLAQNPEFLKPPGHAV